jgi:hypothetical protein
MADASSVSPGLATLTAQGWVAPGVVPPLGGLPAAELQALRGMQLADKAESVTQRRHSIWDWSLEPAAELLAIPSPYDDNITPSTKSVVHPSLVYAPSGWNGYRYWLAHTPYPLSNSDLENPCIVASNDLRNWVVPPGLVNPIVPKPVSGASDYNADVHIYLHTDGYLYMLFRERRSSNGTNYLKGLRSLNGVTWSAPFTLRTGPTASQDFGTPSFWHDGTQWVIISHNLDAGAVVQRQTKTGDLLSDWSAQPVNTLTLPSPDGLAYWHSSINRLADGRLVGVASDTANAGGAAGGQCWLLQSDDAGTTWAVRKISNYPRWYRSALLVTEDTIAMIAGWNSQLGEPGWRFHLQPMRVGNRNVRRVAALDRARALGMDSDDQNVVVVADPFTGGAAALTAPWTQVDANTINLDGSGRATNLNVSNCRAWVEGGSSDYSVNVRIQARTATGQAFLMFRYKDANNYWRVGVNSDATLLLQSIVAGGIVVNQGLNAQPAPITYPITLRVECEGQSINVYKDGGKVIDYNTTVHIDGTKAGLQASSNLGVLFDDFLLHRLG